MISYIFLGLFFIAAVLNVIGAREWNGRLFTVTKPMLMALLCLYVIFRGLPSPDLLLAAALIACWLGDILLLFKGDLWFAVGGISFFVGHVLIILVFAREVDTGSLPLAVLIPAVLLYCAASGAVMLSARKKAPRIMRLPMLLYLLCNAVTNLFALTRLIVSPGIWTAASFAGAVLFFLSDCALFLARYGAGPARFFKTNVFVMTTYILGVSLIVLGLVQAGV